MDAISQGISGIRTALDKTIGRREQLMATVQASRTRIEELEQSVKDHEEACATIKHVAQKTQDQLRFHVTNIPTIALETVFPEEDLSVNLTFDQKRNTTEALIEFLDSKIHLVDPQEACGGGVGDVGSFGLRMSSWKLATPATRPILILDEPFKFLDKTKIGLGAQMIKELSDKMGIQIIMVTHLTEMEDVADRVYAVNKTKQGDWRVAKAERKF